MSLKKIIKFINSLSINNIIGFIISIGSLIFLFHIYDINDLFDPLRAANYSCLLTAIFISIVNFFLRAIRWRTLFVLKKPKQFINVFRAMMQGYLFNTILPARAGELVRVYRLSKDEAMSNFDILGTLLIERVGDMIFLILLMGGVFFLYPDFPYWLKLAGLIIITITSTITIVLAILHFQSHKLSPYILLLMNRFLPNRFFLTLKSSGKRFMASLSGLFKIKNISLFLFFTLILWVLEVFMAYYVASSFDLFIPLGNLLFLILVITVGTIIPSSPGYIGVYELFGITGLKLIGISGEEGLSFIITLHAIAILVPSLIGSISLIKGSFLKNKTIIKKI